MNNKMEETKVMEGRASLESRKRRRAMESHMHCDNNTEGLTDNALQKQDETQTLDEPRPDNVEQNQNPGERDTDNEKERQIGQNEDDDVEVKRDEASRCHQDSTHSNITAENTNKSEELKDAKVVDAAVNVGEKSKGSCEQPLEEETKTKEQKQKGDLPLKMREHQDEDTVLEEPEGDKAEHKRDVGERDSDAEEKTQMGHSEEDDKQKGKDSTNEAVSLQTGGEIVKNDTSNGETSHYMTSGINCATPSGEKRNGDEKKQEKMPRKRDNTHSSITQTNTTKMKDDCNDQHLDKKKKTDKKKQTVTHEQRLHHGLNNQGATCYLNSVLQVLFMTTEIHDRLDPNFETDRELKNIFERLKTEISGTENITKILEIKNVYKQRDAPECLELILRKISPGASEVFHGKLAHTTKCPKGHSINEETNPFWTLPLSLKDTSDTTYSVESSFESFFQKVFFTGDNKVYCNECNNKTDATSECEMVKSPQILTLLLKRFEFDYNIMSYVKSHRCVEVPLTLQRKDKKYKLYGTVDHIGGLYGGHYTATVLSNEDETWYECNDSRVHKVQEQFAKTGTYRSRTVYLLMYRATADVTPEVREHQDEDTVPEEPEGDKVEHKRDVGERDSDAEEKTQMGHSEEDNKQKEIDLRNEAASLQTGGEIVKNDTSNGETSHYMTSGVNCAKQNEGKHRGDENAQEDKSKNKDSNRFNITPENTNKSEELKYAKVDDAAVNVGDKSKDSCEQHLDDKTKT